MLVCLIHSFEIKYDEIYLMSLSILIMILNRNIAINCEKSKFTIKIFAELFNSGSCLSVIIFEADLITIFINYYLAFEIG